MKAEKTIPEIYEITLTMNSREALLLRTMIGSLSGLSASNLIKESYRPISTTLEELNNLVNDLYSTLQTVA